MGGLGCWRVGIERGWWIVWRSLSSSRLCNVRTRRVLGIGLVSGRRGGRRRRKRGWRKKQRRRRKSLLHSGGQVSHEFYTLGAVSLSCSILLGQIGGRELTRNTHYVLAFFNDRKACGLLLRVLLHQSSALADELVNETCRGRPTDGQIQFPPSDRAWSCRKPRGDLES